MKTIENTSQDADSPQLLWHKLNSTSAGGEFFKLGDVYRAKVPEGWFVMVTNNARGLMFYPDPDHNWNGGSLSSPLPD
jgi:hypothetical protein